MTLIPKAIKICLMFLVLAAAASSNAWAKQKVEIYTYDVLPPFAFMKGDKLTGIYIEMTRRRGTDAGL